MQSAWKSNRENKAQGKREKLVDVVTGTKSNDAVYFTLIHRNVGEGLGFAQVMQWDPEPIGITFQRTNICGVSVNIQVANSSMIIRLLNSVLSSKPNLHLNCFMRLLPNAL